METEVFTRQLVHAFNLHAAGRHGSRHVVILHNAHTSPNFSLSTWQRSRIHHTLLSWTTTGHSLSCLSLRLLYLRSTSNAIDVGSPSILVLAHVLLHSCASVTHNASSARWYWSKTIASLPIQAAHVQETVPAFRSQSGSRHGLLATRSDVPEDPTRDRLPWICRLVSAAKGRTSILQISRFVDPNAKQ